MLGKITELIKGGDEQVCSAKVLLPTRRVIGRPLNLLYPVEISDEKQCTNDESTTNDPGCSDLEGRKRPQRQAAVRAMELYSK